MNESPVFQSKPPFVTKGQTDFSSRSSAVTAAFWRKLETSKPPAQQHGTLTANQHNSTATQLRLVHKNKHKHRQNERKADAKCHSVKPNPTKISFSLLFYCFAANKFTLTGCMNQINANNYSTDCLMSFPSRFRKYKKSLKHESKPQSSSLYLNPQSLHQDFLKFTLKLKKKNKHELNQIPL